MNRRRPSRPVLAFELGAFLSALIVPAVASAQGVRASVDRNPVSIQDRVLFRITVEGTRAAQPQLPELPDFRVINPNIQSTSVHMVDGQMTASISFDLYLVPKRTGTFEIGRVTVEIGGKIYASKPFELTVNDASTQANRERDYFLTARVSETKPYVGQQVIYTWGFYRRLHVEVGDARLTSLDFGDMVSEDLGEVRQYSTTLNGVEYTVSEIKKAVFPQRAGEAVIPPSELICQVALPGRRRRRSFFDLGRSSMEQKVLRTQAITLDVRPLPAPPPGFSGLVGDFDIQARVSKSALRVGESTTLSVTLSGTGNVQMMNAPQLPELGAFKVYEDKPSGTIRRSGSRLTGKKTYRSALVPLVPGSQSIPPLQLVYFDPKAGSYQTETTSPLVLDISPSEGREDLMLTESVAPSTGKVAVRVLADDIQPIRRALDALSGGRIDGVRAWGWSGAGVLPPLCFLGLFLVRRRQARFQEDTGLRKRQVAMRLAARRLKEIQRHKVAHYDAQTLARDTSLCLRNYVGHKLGAEGGVLTPAEVERLLLTGGADSRTVRRSRELLERLEATQYGLAGGSALDSERLARSVADLLKDLDRQLGSRA